VGYCEGEGTGADRLPGLGIKNGLGFPPNQQQLVDHVVRSVEGTDTTLVVILINGSPILIDVTSYPRTLLHPRTLINS
jgi:hypothetical protein